MRITFGIGEKREFKRSQMIQKMLRESRRALGSKWFPVLNRKGCLCQKQFAYCAQHSYWH